MNRLFWIFSNCQLVSLSIVLGCEYPDSKDIYGRVNKKNEKWTKMLDFVLLKVTLPGVIMPNFIISYFLYFATDLGSEAFRLPFPKWYIIHQRYNTFHFSHFVIKAAAWKSLTYRYLWIRLPFDWKTPLGYLLVSVAQLGSSYFVIQIAILLMAFFVTSCWTLTTTIDDIKEQINNLNEIARSKGNVKSLKGKLCEFITFDVNARQ